MRPLFLSSLLLLALLFAAVPAPPVAAQGFPFDFDLTVPEGVIEVPVLQQGSFEITVTDRSRDSTLIVPGAPPVGVLFHQVEIAMSPGFEDHEGWLLSAPGGFNILPGETRTTTFNLMALTTATNPYYKALVNVTMRAEDGSTVSHSATVLFFTKGIPGFGVPSGSLVQNLEPRQNAQVSIQVVNFGSLPRGFDFALAANECGLKVAPPPSQILAAHERRDVTFTVRGPESRFDPLGAPYCRIAVEVTAHDNPGMVRSQTVTVQLAPAIALDPLAVFYFLFAVLLLVLLILFLRRRKERLEEEILGKPQKPWTIPVEQVYLRHLKAKDPRAWYVVRHYLMEDEYRSSLMWYKAYKKATKSDRKKERLVLAQEKAYARWKAGWEKNIAKPVAKADRFEAKLQRKLDRKARKAHRKATRRWRAQVKKAEAKHAKRVEKEEKLHDKLVARARKKGLPEPEPLRLGGPELPDEPTAQPRPLAEHRWARKAARTRKRMLRKQGNLEVKFERADARKQLKLQRKVEKLSRDIEDADFVAQHAAHSE